MEYKGLKDIVEEIGTNERMLKNYIANIYRKDYFKNCFVEKCRKHDNIESWTSPQK